MQKGSLRFSIITPTYNRGKYLGKIHECLQVQTENNFEWIIIDDGSVDDTKMIVDTFDKKTDIKYIYQKNSGKPSAVNKGVQIASGYISVILDSDDLLLPETLQTVYGYYNKETGYFIGDCISITGLCSYHDGNIIGDIFPQDHFISDHISCRYNMGIKGDKCEFFLTSILKKYPFPIFEGEKFVTEDVVWNRIAQDGKTLYINNVFMVKEYLKGGLSSKYKELLEKNPKGAALYYNKASINKFFFAYQIKHTIDYIRYSKMAGDNNLFKNALNKKCFILCYLFACNNTVYSIVHKIYRLIKNDS